MPADLDLHCLKRQGSAGLGLISEYRQAQAVLGTDQVLQNVLSDCINTNTDIVCTFCLRSSSFKAHQQIRKLNCSNFRTSIARK